jgi:hypothetical protein
MSLLAGNLLDIGLETSRGSNVHDKRFQSLNPRWNDLKDQMNALAILEPVKVIMKGNFVIEPKMVFSW